jgi:hypothetical protein
MAAASGRVFVQQIGHGRLRVLAASRYSSATDIALDRGGAGSASAT